MHQTSLQTICICGAGTMGSGIAQLCAAAGFQTILFDVNDAMLQKGKLSVNKGLDILVSKQKITDDESKVIFDRLLFTNQIEDCRADLVIEAIVENIEIKTTLFSQLHLVNSPKTIFASNTSSLSISALQQKTENPNRLAGMHFFNPAPVMKLVEVVKGAQTDDDTIQTIYELAIRLGKTPVICNDAPGFIVNRIARPYYLEAMKLVEQGVASTADVDHILESAGFKMGPFALMDLIGLDINYAVSNIVWKSLNEPERLRPSDMQMEKVAEGNLGRKTGRGFYAYETKNNGNN